MRVNIIGSYICARKVALGRTNNSRWNSKKTQNTRPIIKPEETVLLRVLNDLLINRNFSSCPIWIHSTWLEYWGEAKQVFQNTTHDYGRFSRELANGWQLSPEKLKNILPALWAILTGYPHRKARKKWDKSAEEIKIEDIIPVTVKLRGFSRKY